jgi:hypothetical protein
MKKLLITLSSPIAVNTSNGVRMVAAVEGTFTHVYRDTKRLRIVSCYDSATQSMQTTTPVSVEVKASNIRSTQEVA